MIDHDGKYGHMFIRKALLLMIQRSGYNEQNLVPNNILQWLDES